MSTLVIHYQGRFGNTAVQYLFARAYAEKHGFEFQSDDWLGERIFEIGSTRPHNYASFPRYNEAQLEKMGGPPDHSFIFRGYAQTQWCVSHYTQRWAKQALKFRPEIESACKQAIEDDTRGGKADTVVCHRRVGDFKGYGYPVVSLESYRLACKFYGLDWDNATVLTEEDPTPVKLPEDISFVADFYRMAKAPTLLRANSTFSWVAGLLSNGIVLSPVIDGLKGGEEHVCPFVVGNSARLANLDFTTELLVNP